jgi:iron complex transport system substrate-binding protein
LATLALVCVSLTAAGQQRIASLNLCTDLLLLELVDSRRIASLSYWSADPSISYLADRTSGLHLNRGLAEQIVPRDPDLVLAGQFSDARVIGLLRKLGYRVEVVDVPLTLAGMRDHIIAFGTLVGEAAAANALADDIDGRLDRLSAKSRQMHAGIGRDPLAVVYGPQGVSPGRGTLMDELLSLAGFRNLAAEAGIVSYGTLDLERLVMAQPDLLIVEDLSDNRDSVAHHALGHPVLAALFPGERIVELPPVLTACVGPAVVEVVDILLAHRLSATTGPDR